MKGGIKAAKNDNDGSGVPRNVLREWPSASTDSNVSHSALTLSVHKFRDFHMSIDVKTESQIRLNLPPKPLEVAWVFWHWKDNTHFNYFIVKTNGAEIGKYYGGVNPKDQKILRMAPYPKAEIGKWMHWGITAQGKHIITQVMSNKIFDFDDISYFSEGKIGLYCEDSVVSFGNVNLNELSGNSS